MRVNSGFTVIEALIVAAVVGIVACMAAPGLVRAQIASNERRAATSLKSVAAAEEAFKNGDADRNGVHDYWTADLAGLYGIRGSSAPALADRDLAQADVFRLPDARRAFAEYDVRTLGTVRAPKSGYWFQAMGLDGEAPPRGPHPYATDTDGSGPFHNTGDFGFCAIPSAHGECGESCFIVNSCGVVFQRDFGSKTPVAVPGQRVKSFHATGEFPLDWPNAVGMAAWVRVR